MEVIKTIDELRARLEHERREGSTVGLVPTMGYLHEGHVSLIERAVSECDHVVATIFVNPLQFAAGEDLDSYPRDPDGDARKASDAGASILFTPELDEMYPEGRDSVLTTVAVPMLAATMEGASRPSHFAGVCTVVAKLFNIVGPCSAYFGEKDYQQLAIIRRMVDDLSFPVRVVGCPTLREPDGLAMSSRNVYLSSLERGAAPILRAALCEAADAVLGGETSPEVLKRIVSERLATQRLGRLDYVEIADRSTLRPVHEADSSSRILAAVKFSKARLIDNLGVSDRDPRSLDPRQ